MYIKSDNYIILHKLLVTAFVVIFENEENEAVKFQFFVDGNYFVEFFKNRKNKLDQGEEIPLDYRVNNRHSRFVKGSALVSPSFFPPKVTLMNMYSLFGVETMLAMTLRAIEIKSGVDFRPNFYLIIHYLLISPEGSEVKTKTMEEANVKRNDDTTVIKEAVLTTVVIDEKSVPETTLPSEDLGKSMVKQNTISQDPGEESDGSTLLDIPMRFVLKNSPGSQTSSKREIYSTKEEKEKLNGNISSKDEEKTENEEITKQEFPPTEGNDNEDTREVPTESSIGDEVSSSIDLKTEFPSITPEQPDQPEQPETEIKTKNNQRDETATVDPATIEEDILVTTNVEVISQDNENTEESKTDSEPTSISTATEPMPESEEGANSSNVDSVIISPEKDNTEDTTLINDFPPTFEDSESLLKAP
ncbi:hypothetical protein Anas_04113 [Armadillidium nasatum]|uniref:Uncharacterized protein n=1 Tax=Armadillidium nasatum TaxID=96803 RepID=A0A5N5TAI1_9CRUS|nr:hypothetical protein Anas_04113 [Armadillidium nasatum]